MTVNLTVCAQTDVGRKRKANEDAFLIADLTGDSLVDTESSPITRFEIGDRGVLLVVSDGMGGHRAGEVASALVVESMRTAMASLGDEPSNDVMIERAVERANRETWEASQTPERAGMGATVTAIFVDHSTAYIAEVGDSRAYVLRGGHLLQVTKDQSYVQLLIDNGAITPEAAEHAPFRNVVLQAMGQSPNVQVALGRLALRQRDCFLLCSDGLTNKVSSEDIQRIILSAPTLDVACTQLVALANDRGGEDNITVILGGVSGDLPALVPGEKIVDTLEIVKTFTATTPA